MTLSNNKEDRDRKIYSKEVPRWRTENARIAVKGLAGKCLCIIAVSAKVFITGIVWIRPSLVILSVLISMVMRNFGE